MNKSIRRTIEILMRYSQNKLCRLCDTFEKIVEILVLSIREIFLLQSINQSYKLVENVKLYAKNPC